MALVMPWLSVAGMTGKMVMVEDVRRGYQAKDERCFQTTTEQKLWLQTRDTMFKNSDSLEEDKTSIVLAFDVAIPIERFERYCKGRHPDRKTALTPQSFFQPSLQNRASHTTSSAIEIHNFLSEDDGQSHVHPSICLVVW
jgi:hypothetical protein